MYEGLADPEDFLRSLTAEALLHARPGGPLFPVSLGLMAVANALVIDRLRKVMLDPPTVMGVERIEVDTFSVRMVARTLPGMQFDVGRELRARVASAFRQEGINVPADLDTGRATGGAS